MNFDLPIEQLVKRTDTRFQLGFATEARERLRVRDEFALSALAPGLARARAERGRPRCASRRVARRLWTKLGGGTAHRPID